MRQVTLERLARVLYHAPLTLTQLGVDRNGRVCSVTLITAKGFIHFQSDELQVITPRPDQERST